jgi:drug/metabolite transporter (DMT)-like permease
MTDLRKGIALNCGSVLIMSVSPLINKFALEYISAGKAAWLNAAFATVACYLYGGVRRQRVGLVWKPYLLLIGLLNSAGVLCLFAALAVLSPVTVGFLGRFYLVFTSLLGLLVLRERLAGRQFVILGLGVAGAFLFVTAKPDLRNALGVGLALAYTLLFALTNMVVKIKAADHSANQVLFMNNLASTVIIAGYLGLTGEVSGTGFRLEGVGLVFVSAMASSFIGLLLFYEGIRFIEFSKASMIRATGPVLTAAYSWPFFPIPLTIANIGGAALLLTSAVFLGTSKPSARTSRAIAVSPIAEPAPAE